MAMLFGVRMACKTRFSRALVACLIIPRLLEPSLRWSRPTSFMDNPSRTWLHTLESRVVSGGHTTSGVSVAATLLDRLAFYKSRDSFARRGTLAR